MIARNQDERIETDEREQLQKNMDLMEYYNEVSSRKSCCLVFSLQTGVLMIVIIDFLVFATLVAITGMTVESFQEIPEGESGYGFTAMTDGICLVLFFIRICFGIRYAKSVLLPPKMDYQYIVEFGKLKWHTKRVKSMRIYFKNYSLAASISSLFIFIQTVILLIVLWEDQEMFFRYVFLIALSAFTLFNLSTVYSHLKELDE